MIYFFPSKRIEDPERYFLINENIITVNPVKRQITLSSPVKGVSVSKTHTLCWTENGKIKIIQDKYFLGVKDR
jgi:hypothetical protein